MWYWSPASGHLSLALFSANNYKCFEGSAGCYDFTSHAPAIDDFCLTRVLAISNDGLDVEAGGVHTWGGPLAGGDFALVLENRDGAPSPAAARWSWLEAPGVGEGTTFCATELYSGVALGAFTGGIALPAPLPPHDAAVLRLSPCAPPAPGPPPAARLPASAFALAPADRWAPRGSGAGAMFLSKWGGATAVAASPVNATAPPFPKALGLLYGTGSSNGFLRVSLNGAVLATLNTFNATTGVSEAVFPLAGLPNHPLWVLSVEATGTWQSGSKDSYVEVAGVNVYYS